jgi:hypothetical protein
MEKQTKVTNELLKTVPIQQAFLFYTDIGEYTGIYADNLTDFHKKIDTIPLASIDFHFKRGDFVKWVRDTLGDEQLAVKINSVNTSITPRKIKTSLKRTVKRRLNQLNKNQ